MKKAIIFDFDYTLGDSTKGIITCTDYALLKLGEEKKSTEEIKKTIGINLNDTYKILSGKDDDDKAELFKKVVLPANIPVFFQSLKVNMGLSLVGVIAGEFLVSKAGLGYLIVYAGQVFKMDLVMMSVVLLGFIAFALYYLINRMEKLAVKMINHI